MNFKSIFSIEAKQLNSLFGYIGITLVSLACCYGFLFPVHFGDSYEFAISASIMSYLFISLVFLNASTKKLTLNITVVGFIGFAFLLLVQPIFNKIYYPEDLLFPITILLTMAYLTSILSNHPNKENLIKLFSIVFIVGVALNSFVLLTQFFKIDMSNYKYIRALTTGERFSGNTAQPNQFASILIVAISICLYFSIVCKTSVKKIVSLVLIGFFSIILALTSSRAGLLALIYVIVFTLLFAPYQKITNRISIAFLMGLFYFVGIKLLRFSAKANEANIASDSVSRMTEGSMWMRISEIKQAWLMFKESPLIGHGWNSYLDYNSRLAENIEFIGVVRHSHSIVGQIMSELGLLGIFATIPFVYVLLKIAFILIKNLKRKKQLNTVVFMSLLSVVGILIYSMAEYPLWYVYFLTTFTVFFSQLDSKEIKILPNISSKPKIIVHTVFFISIAVVSFLYRQSYMKYKFVEYKTQSPEISSAKVSFYLNQIYFPIGMKKFKHRILLNHIDKYDMSIEEKIKISASVMSQLSTNDYMIKYIRALEQSSDFGTASIYKKAACKRGIKSYCS